MYDTVTGNLLRTFDDPHPSIDEEGFRHDDFGSSVAIDGNKVLVGDRADDTLGEFVGQAYLFDTVTGNLLQTFNDPTPTPGGPTGDAFGWSVAIDGNNVLIGAFRDDTLGTRVGQAHLFDAVTVNLLWTFNDATPTQEPTDSFSGDTFGRSVAISGNNVLIGAPRDDTIGLNVGQAHLFDAVSGNLLRTFNDPTPTPGWVDDDGVFFPQYGANLAIRW